MRDKKNLTLESHPVWVRGLKHEKAQMPVKAKGSHPVWVRGLKPLRWVISAAKFPSHPVWVRGLKQKNSIIFHKFVCVAPRVGAWIET